MAKSAYEIINSIKNVNLLKTDESEARALYLNVSFLLKDEGFIELAERFKEMSKEEGQHEKTIRNIAGLNAVPIEKQVADVQVAKAAYKWFIETGGIKGLLYSNWFMPLAKNYDKKRAKGIYDEKLALKGFRELAAGILGEYKDNVIKNPKARMIFATKQALGKLLLDYYNEAFVNKARI